MNTSNKYFISDNLPVVLGIIYGIVWTILAIHPLNRYDWLLENILVAIAVSVLYWTHKKNYLSNTSYVLIFFFLVFHSIGAHYTYSDVPIGNIISEFFNAERNHYDRFVHFSGGLLMVYPFRELFSSLSGMSNKRWSRFVSILIIIALGEMYEIIEWLTASIVAPEAALAFLGSQGDVFDAQKDIALNLSGSLITTIISIIFEKK